MLRVPSAKLLHLRLDRAPRARRVRPASQTMRCAAQSPVCSLHRTCTRPAPGLQVGSFACAAHCQMRRQGAPSRFRVGKLETRCGKEKRIRLVLDDVQREALKSTPAPARRARVGRGRER
ncbi:hypothetical protein AOQ84DRAFT_379942 [Glonium stellatum]|uniref:Uncharacterized protein n=1 Tax=Glonium stellatum TaxID=574774 RepID=A0A8E2JQ86_9PEZI|nr:hypothetical protein AOQ84DRAFT_379942 [Glonium stellatum]